MPATVHLRALRRAADIAGGSVALALALGIATFRLQRWLAGAEQIPTDVFLRAVDFLAEHDARETSPENGSTKMYFLPPFVRQLADVTLRSAVTLHGTDLGTLQVVNPSGELEVVSHRGFSTDFVEFFRRVAAGDGSACGEALMKGQRVFIGDIRTNPVFDRWPKCRETVLGSGAVSVQSTPVVAKASGRLLGVLSTHFRNPPEEQDVWDVTLLAEPLGRALDHVLAA